MWNNPTYNADDSMAAVLRELAGANDNVHDALLAFVDLDQNWPYRSSENEQNKDIKPSKLVGRLDLLTTLPNTLSRMAWQSRNSQMMWPLGRRLPCSKPNSAST
ncbi:hypothetical protein N7539_004316 [Penicillium diatomitis]|uniref:Uncharacterized protein n=1 Tax=Penicillium diatomitis TaxID=2819901 RepID=A0A9W9XDP1_9EURO|nr:uncharacterized protein N7539_004316 [Penicillium diatomitis]KAJ5489426.1 hypothetical protein N7539_004316 [Penicillium diatomitis]